MTTKRTSGTNRANESQRDAANDNRPTITMIAMASLFGGYDMLIRSAWDGELEIEVGADLPDTLASLAGGSSWAEGGDHRIGRTGRDEWMLNFDRGADGKVALQLNAIQLAELTATIRDVRPDGRTTRWDMLGSAA